MIEVLKQALEALEYIDNNYMSLPKVGNEATTSLRQAIAELESQEPVAVWELFEDGWDSIADPEWMESLPIGTKLYTHPPKRTEQEPLANELAQLKKEIALLKYKLWDCEEKSKPMQGQ